MKDKETSSGNVVNLFKGKGEDGVGTSPSLASVLTQEKVNEYFDLIDECEAYYNYIPQEQRDLLCKLLMSFSKSMIQDYYDKSKEIGKE